MKVLAGFLYRKLLFRVIRPLEAWEFRTIRCLMMYLLHKGILRCNHRSTISFTSLTSTISTSSSTGKDRRMDSFSTMSRGTFRTVTPSLTKSNESRAHLSVASVNFLNPFGTLCFTVIVEVIDVWQVGNAGGPSRLA